MDQNFETTIKNLFNSLHDRLTIIETKVDHIEYFLNGHTARVISELDDLKREMDSLKSDFITVI
jgi:predicted ATPase